MRKFRPFLQVHDGTVKIYGLLTLSEGYTLSLALGLAIASVIEKPDWLSFWVAISAMAIVVGMACLSPWLRKRPAKS